MTDPLALAVLWQGAAPEDHAGEHEALVRNLDSGRIRSLDVTCYRPDLAGDLRPVDWPRLLGGFVDRAMDARADVVHFQYFHGRSLPDLRPVVAQLRRQARPPIIVTSVGDPLGAPLNPAPRSLLAAASVSDLVVASSMGSLAARLLRAGAPRVTLVPLSADEVRFAQLTHDVPVDDDVVFVGSLHSGRHPLRRHRWVAHQRRRLVTALSDRFGARFALYGRGWEGCPSWRGPVRYSEQLEVIASAAVVVGGYPHSHEPYYLSDRPFISMRSGRPVVDLRVEGVGSVLEPGVEWELADRPSEVVTCVERLLDDPERAAAIGAGGAAAVESRHLTRHRVDLVLQMCDELIDARKQDRSARCPPLRYAVEGSALPGASVGW